MRTLLLAVVLSFPAVAGAGEALVVHGPAGASDQDRDAALREVARVFERTVGADNALSVDQIAPASDAVLVPYGAAVERCGGPSVALAQIRENTARGAAAADDLDYEQATAILEQSRADLVCANALMDPDDVEAASWTLGLVAHYQGDREGAERWFAEALGVHPDHVWDDTYPPEAQQTFNHALSGVLRRPDSALIVPAADAVREVRVDGRVVDPLAGRVTIKAGWHVVQWRTAAGSVEAAIVEPADGAPVALLSRAGLREAILAGPAAPEQLAAARDRLTVLAEARGVDEIYVAGGPGGVVYRFDARTSAFQAAPGAGVGAVQARAPAPGPSLALVLAGAGTAAAGAVIGLSGYAEGVDVRSQWELTYDEELAAQYGQLMTRNQVGYIVAGVGAAVVVSGIVAAVAERQQRVAFGAVPVAGGAHVGFTLSF